MATSDYETMKMLYDRSRELRNRAEVALAGNDTTELEAVMKLLDETGAKMNEISHRPERI